MTKENVRIAVRDAQDSQTVAFMDNSAKQAIHFSHADLTRFFEGDSTVLQMTIDKEHELTSHVRAGAKLSFIYKNKNYWLNIMSTKDISHQRELTAFSLSLELNKEQIGAYSANRAMTFQEFLNIIDTERTLEIGINEIKNKRVKLEWEGSQSKLGRIYSLANKMDAEIAFETVLNDDYSLKSQIINVYQKNDGTHQGIGQDKSNVILRVGQDLKLINREESLDNFYSAIRGYGKDGVTINNLVFEEKDEQGNILYFSLIGQDTIWAPQARDRYPSFVSSESDGYLVEKKEETEYTTSESLKGYLLSELKKNSKLYVNYESEGHFDSDPGDTYSLEDTINYDPPLYLEARVYEQTESLILGNYSSDKTTFSNFVEKQSEIDDSLLSRVQALIDANKKYEYQLLSSSGFIFKNRHGETDLTARILDGINDVTSNFSILWYRNQEAFSEEKTIIVNATDFDDTAIYRYEAKDLNGNTRGGAEVTVTNVNDGEPGQQGEPGTDGQPTGIDVGILPPDSPYKGMLWQNSGDNEYIKNATYRWEESKWELYRLVADNIYVENLEALTSRIGEIYNDYIKKYDDNTTAIGTLAIKDAEISNRGTIKNASGITQGDYEQLLSHQLLSMLRLSAEGATQYYAGLSFNELRMIDNINGFNGRITAEQLTKVNWENIPLASGFTSAEGAIPQYRRVQMIDGSYEMQFRGKVAPTSGNYVPGAGYAITQLTYKPYMKELFMCGGNGGRTMRLQTETDGWVTIMTADSGTNYISLSGIRYECS